MVAEGGTLEVEIIANAAKLSGSIASETQKSVSKISSQLSKAGAALGIALGSTFVVRFAKTAIAAADEAEKVNRELAKALEPLGAIGQASLQPIVDWAADLQFSIGQDDEVIKTLSVHLLNLGEAFFRAVGPQAAEDLEKLTLGLEDMAAATGKSVSLLTRSLGPAILNTPEKALPLLEKLGTVTADQAAHFAALAKSSGDYAATQAIINALSTKYAGQAAAAATPTEKLSVSFQELSESIGKLLLPALSRFATFLQHNSAGLLRFVEILGAAGGIAFAASHAREAISALTQALTSMNPVVALAAAGITALAIGFAQAAQDSANNEAFIDGLSRSLADMTVSLHDVNAQVAEQTATWPEWAKTQATAAIATAEHRAKILQLEQALAAGTITQRAFVMQAQALGLTEGQIAAELHGVTRALNDQSGPLKRQNAEWKATAANLTLSLGSLSQVKKGWDLTAAAAVHGVGIVAAKQQELARDIKKIDHLDVGKGLKDQLLKLGPDMVHAFAQGNAGQQQKILASLRIYNDAVRSTKDAAQHEALQLGQSIVDGTITGITLRAPALEDAARNLVQRAIEAAKDQAGVHSPSTVMAELGRDLMLGLQAGIDSRIQHLTDQLRDLVRNFGDALGVGASDQAKAFIRDLDGLGTRFDRLAQHVSRFRDAIRQGFSGFSDLIGTIQAQLDDFNQQQQAFASGASPTAPTPVDIHALIAQQVADATSFASVLQQLQAAGLSTANLQQLAAGGPANLGSAQALLADPALIAQLNEAQAQIASITKDSADELEQAGFGDKVAKLSEAFGDLLNNLHKFIGAIPIPDLTDSTREFIHALDHLSQVLENFGVGGNGAPHLSSGGTIAQTGLAVVHQGEIVLPAGGSGVTINFPNYLGSKAELVEAIHDGLLRKRRNNGPLGLD